MKIDLSWEQHANQAKPGSKTKDVTVDPKKKKRHDLQVNFLLLEYSFPSPIKHWLIPY